MSAPRFAPGHIVAGRYSVRSLLAHTGASASYHGLVEPSRDVVVKIFDPRLASSSDFMVGLEQTEAAVRKLPAHVVVPILESGIDAQTGAPFQVTALEPTPSLGQLVELCPLSIEETLVLLRNVGVALDSAFEVGLLHLALRPSNVFVGTAPAYAVRLMDFRADLGRGLLTGAAGPASAAPWVAPEQLEGGAAGRTADVFSAALLAFYAVTGRAFLRSCDPGPVDVAAWKRELRAPRAPASVRAAELGQPLDAALDAVFARALAVDPSARFSSVTAFVDALASPDMLDAPREAPSPAPVERRAPPPLGPPKEVAPVPVLPPPLPSISPGLPPTSSLPSALAPPAPSFAAPPTSAFLLASTGPVAPSDTLRPRSAGRVRALSVALLLGGAVLLGIGGVGLGSLYLAAPHGEEVTASSAPVPAEAPSEASSAEPASPPRAEVPAPPPSSAPAPSTTAIAFAPIEPTPPADAGPGEPPPAPSGEPDAGPGEAPPAPAGARTSGELTHDASLPRPPARYLGTLAVECDPACGSVLIDGRLLKDSTAPLFLPAGARKVFVMRPGHRSEFRVIQLEPGATVRLSLPLRPAPAAPIRKP